VSILSDVLLIFAAVPFPLPLILLHCKNARRDVAWVQYMNNLSFLSLRPFFWRTTLLLVFSVHTWICYILIFNFNVLISLGIVILFRICM
jgi:hypothetical protein